MLKKHQKKSPVLRRKRRIRKRIFGTADRPRLSVYRSNKHMYAQVIDDMAGRTLVSACTRSRELREKVKSTGTVKAASEVGALLAKKAKKSKVSRVVFDRNRYRYHGRVKALADAIRQGGLEF